MAQNNSPSFSLHHSPFEFLPFYMLRSTKACLGGYKYDRFFGESGREPKYTKSKKDKEPTFTSTEEAAAPEGVEIARA